MNREWSRLDNAGKIYPANVNVRNTTLFRFQVELIDDVVPLRLQASLDTVMIRFPYFQVKLQRGLFWYYFIRTKEPIPAVEDIYYPCTQWDFKKIGFPFSVKYRKNVIAVEFSHSITDGTGAIEFFKALLLEYYRRGGLVPADTSGIKIPGEPIDEEEYSDGFSTFYDMHIPASENKNVKAFHLNYRPAKKGVYHVTTGSMDFSEIRAAAKKKNINVTTFICLTYFQVFQQIAYEKKARPAPIVINLPVNLRHIFGSKTMFNFFISITPKIDLRLGFFNESDIIKHINHYLGIEIDRRYVGKMIKRNIKLERNMLVRITPLFIKELLLPFIFRIWGERGYTSGISNLGRIDLPEEIEERIESFTVIPPPSPGNTMKMICFTFKGRFNITFGSLTENKTVEKKFFGILRKCGIPVKIKTIS